METTFSDSVHTGRLFGLGLMFVTSQQEDAPAEENLGPVQYKRATIRRPGSVLTHARLKLSTVQRRYKSDFNCEVSFFLVVNAGDFVYVDRPPRALTEAPRREPGRSQPTTTEAFRELLTKSAGLHFKCLAADTAFHKFEDGVFTSMSTDRDTKMPIGFRTLQSSTATQFQKRSRAANVKAATFAGPTVQKSRGAGSVREDEI